MTRVVVLHTVSRRQEQVIFHENVAAGDVIYAVECEEQLPARDKWHLAHIRLLGVGCRSGVGAVGRCRVKCVHIRIGSVRRDRRLLALRRPIRPDVLRRFVECLALKGEKIAVG